MGSLDPSAAPFIPSRNNPAAAITAAYNHQLVGLETDNPPSSSLPLNEGASTSSPPVCWGWLEPSAPNLPYVMLRGPDVAIGRGHDIFEGLRSSSAAALMDSPDTSSASPKPLKSSSGAAGPSDAAQEQSLFVYIADGRVSRRHCLLTQGTVKEEGTAKEDGAPLAEQSIVLLKDLSTNGTFLNGTKLPQGQSMAVKDGDRISLVLSVAPLVEQAFTYHAGHPLAHHMLAGPPPSQWVGWVGPASSIMDSEPSNIEQTIEAAGAPAGATGDDLPPASPISSAGSSPPVHLHTEGALRRSATTTYCTAEAALAEPSLLHCQICMEPFRQAVALEPCGHSFCAVCLSHHLGTRLKNGQNLSCPLRCEAPQRVVAATLIRQLAAQLAASEGVEEAGEETEATAETAVAETGANNGGEDNIFNISLKDSDLPLELGSLKFAHLQEALDTLATIVKEETDSADRIAEIVMQYDFNMNSSNLAVVNNFFSAKGRAVQALHQVARLAWSDEEAREIVLLTPGNGGLGTVLKAMTIFLHFDDVQCSGCLALLALLRGEGNPSAQLRLEMAISRGAQVVLQGMRAHSKQSMVQLGALMCLVQLALEEPSLEESICREGLDDILCALRTHKDEEDVVAKAFLCLGSLAHSGSSAAQQAAAKMVAEGVPKEIARVLRQYGGKSEDVLWAAMFLLGVLVRDQALGGKVRVARLTEVASAGVLGPLRVALEEYRNLAQERGGDADPMFIEVGTSLISMLERAMDLIMLRRLRLLTSVVAGVTAVVLGIKSYRRLRGGSSWGRGKPGSG